MIWQLKQSRLEIIPEVSSLPFLTPLNSIRGENKTRHSKVSTLLKIDIFKKCLEGSVRKFEKSFLLFRMLISLYCPLGGTVLGSFAGTGTTAIAAMQCSRIANATERDMECYRLALNQTQKAKLGMCAQLEANGPPNIVKSVCGKRVSSAVPYKIHSKSNNNNAESRNEIIDDQDVKRLSVRKMFPHAKFTSHKR